MATVRQSFTEFFEAWEARHTSHHEKLLAHVQDDPETEEESLRHLVEQAVSHYQEYYVEKFKAAESDVFLMFSPPWFSSFERTLLWATGFNPSMTFRLVRESVGDELTEEQMGKLATVKEETRRMEKQITQTMASVQESVAAPPLYELVKREASLVDGEASELENAVEELKGAMLKVMRDADTLRQNTAGDVLEILSLGQKVKLLAATSQFWLQSRTFGIQKDKEMNGNKCWVLNKKN